MAAYVVPFGDVTDLANSSGVPIFWLTIDAAPRIVWVAKSNAINGSNPYSTPASASA